MRAFISWSGPQSKHIAAALRTWLPMTLQAAKPYMSERDNEAGSRWGNVVAAELEASDFGIVCLTPTNIDSRWINFESGALSKAVGKAHVVPLLYQLKASDVPPPLSQFMMKSADEAGLLDVLIAMNNALDADRRLEAEALAGAYKAMWPALKAHSVLLAEDVLHRRRVGDTFDGVLLAEDVLHRRRVGDTFELASKCLARYVCFVILTHCELSPLHTARDTLPRRSRHGASGPADTRPTDPTGP